MQSMSRHPPPDMGMQILLQPEIEIRYGYLGQLHRRFSPEICCRYRETTLDFDESVSRQKSKPYFGVLSVLRVERHLDISGNFTDIFSPEIGRRYRGTTLDFGESVSRQKSKSDISVCSLSLSRMTSGYLGQLHIPTSFSRDWLSLSMNDIRFRRIRFAAEIYIRRLRMKLCLSYSHIK